MMKSLFKINPKLDPAGWDRKKRIMREVFSKAALYLVLVIMAIVMCLPFYWSIITAIRVNDEIYSLPVTLFPSKFTLEHFRRVFNEIPFFRMLLNSLITTGVGVFTNLFFGSLAAYAFSKIRFRGHKIIFNILLSSMMIPGVITLIPTFFVLLRFPLAGGNNFVGQGGIGFYDNLAAVILPGAIGVYGIFFMRQFFVSLPDDLAESADRRRGRIQDLFQDLSAARSAGTAHARNLHVPERVEQLHVAEYRAAKSRKSVAHHGVQGIPEQPQHGFRSAHGAVDHDGDSRADPVRVYAEVFCSGRCSGRSQRIKNKKNI